MNWTRRWIFVLASLAFGVAVLLILSNLITRSRDLIREMKSQVSASKTQLDETERLKSFSQNQIDQIKDLVNRQSAMVQQVERGLHRFDRIEVGIDLSLPLENPDLCCFKTKLQEWNPKIPAGGFGAGHRKAPRVSYRLAWPSLLDQVSDYETPR